MLVDPRILDLGPKYKRLKFGVGQAYDRSSD
jgi:hypothetical protein